MNRGIPTAGSVGLAGCSRKKSTRNRLSSPSVSSPADNPFLFSKKIIFCIYFGGLECVGPSYVAHFVFVRDVRIRTQRATVESRRASSLATHLPT
jgi:hypothetical protein